MISIRGRLLFSSVAAVYIYVELLCPSWEAITRPASTISDLKLLHCIIFTKDTGIKYHCMAAELHGIL